MGNVGSRANSRVSRRALAMGDAYISTPRGTARRFPMQGIPDWYAQMQGTSLGDDTLGAMSTEQFQAQSLANQRELIDAHKHWAEGDKLQKWIAIGATLAIPLSAAIWRALGVGRRRRTGV
jgi:hypothetical protein